MAEALERDRLISTFESVWTKNVELLKEDGALSGSVNVNGFRFSAKNGKGGASLWFTEDGEPFLELIDAEGKTRLVLGAAETVIVKTGAKQTAPVSSITLFGKDGRVTRRIE